MQNIDEKQIKEVLGNHKIILTEIRRRILAIHNEIIDTDSILKTVSMKKLELNSVGTSGGSHKDLLDAMLRHQKMEQQYIVELSTEIYRLTEEEECVNRIMVCFRALRGREYTYIERLYVKKEAYKIVEQESGYSHKTFESIRSNGLKQIKKLYESTMSNVQILKNTEEQRNHRKQNEHNNDFEQLSLKL